MTASKAFLTGSPALVAIAVLTASDATAFDVHPEASAQGWFFSVNGTIESTDLDALDFDSAKGQPDVRGGVRLGDRHHVEAAYLRVRRTEQGTASAVVLGVVAVENEVAIDLDVDYVRGHYGYSLLANDWVDLQPFLEVAYLREETNIRNLDTGQSNHQEDSAVFPLPGLEVAIPPKFPLYARAKVTGIGTGQGHLIDVEGGVEGRFRWVFGGVGYRHVDFRVEESDGDEAADVSLDGVYVEAGFRF